MAPGGMWKTYRGEIPFRLESHVFPKAKSLKASEDKFP